ncbi:hypothetical protein, partial [Eubacterium callanderi]|uniref:hypothetical protein n=1 Tax=Eubacterium callanderi TaxID=53442 RepID=UPI00210B0FC3
NIKETGVKAKMVRFGGMSALFFTDQEICDFSMLPCELHYQRTSGSVFGAEHGEAGAVGSVPRGRTDPPLRSGLAVQTQAVSEVA